MRPFGMAGKACGAEKWLPYCADAGQSWGTNPLTTCATLEPEWLRRLSLSLRGHERTAPTLRTSGGGQERCMRADPAMRIARQSQEPKASRAQPEVAR